MRGVKTLSAFALVVAATATPALGQSRAEGRIVDFELLPATMTVQVGTTVTWRNEGKRPHTVTDRGGAFDTQPISPGATGSITFGVPGRYAYFCRINPGRMNATIVVTPGSGPAQVVRVQATDPARGPTETLRFDPAELSVETGTTILFANVGGKPHTLTADDGSFDSGVVTPGSEGGRFAGANATVTPEKPGRFGFHCEVHPAAMKGVLTVTGQERKAAGAASGAPRSTGVRVVDFDYKERQAAVAPGGTVTWKNTGDAPHTATFDDVQLDTGQMAPGAEGKLVAPQKPGSYSYHCEVHPARMRAVLVVVGQNVTDPTKVALASSASAGGGGAGGGVTALALTTGMIGAFLGGFGISAFARNRMGASG